MTDPYYQQPTSGQPPASGQQPMSGQPASTGQEPMPYPPAYGTTYPPAYGTAYPPAYGTAAPTHDPGKTLGIVGFVLSFLGPLTVAGLIVSIIGLVKSRRAQHSNGLALAGTIIGAIGTLIGIVVTIIAIVGVVNVVETCRDLGPGTHYRDGITYTCS